MRVSRGDARLSQGGKAKDLARIAHKSRTEACTVSHSLTQPLDLTSALSPWRMGEMVMSNCARRPDRWSGFFFVRRLLPRVRSYEGIKCFCSACRRRNRIEASFLAKTNPVSRGLRIPGRYLFVLLHEAPIGRSYGTYGAAEAAT
jgi:hypothetical protein